MRRISFLSVFVLVSLVLVSCVVPTATPSPLPTATPPPSPLPTHTPEPPGPIPDDPYIPPWLDLKFNLSGGVSMEVFAVALFLVVVANRLVEALAVPVFDKFNWDKFLVQYIAWAVGGLLVWLSGVNLFTAYLPDPLAGQILTAVLSGGGATLLHDIFDGGAPKASGYDPSCHTHRPAPTPIPEAGGGGVPRCG